MLRNAKHSSISIGKNLPKRVQEIKKKILIPAMKKARGLDPRNKAAAVVIGDKLVVNGRQYLHFNIPKLCLDNQLSYDSNEEPIYHDGETSLDAYRWLSGGTSGCHAGGREFVSGRTNTQGLKITE